MSAQETQQTMQAYLDALSARGDYGRFFAADVTFTLMGPGQTVQGSAAVEQFIRGLHEQAFDAQPVFKHVISGDGQAALEADFVGVHTGEFLGVPPTGRTVRVPYSVIYDLAGSQITALRGYLPIDAILQQLQGGAG
jgi:predicted ester cyclase